MGQSIEKKGIVPSGAEHFVAHAQGFLDGLKDIDGELSDDGEIFGGVILAAAASVFGEEEIGGPVEIVLDSPVSAYDVEEFAGREHAGDQEEAYLGWLAAGGGAPAFDAAHGSNVGKAILPGQPRRRHDDGSSALDAAMGAGTSLGCRWGVAGGANERFCCGEELAAIALERQDVVSLAVANGLGDVGPTM